MLHMVLMAAGVYCYIIQVDKDKFILFSHKCYIHSSLKGGSSIHQPKRHLGIHKGAPRSGECSFLLIIRMHSNLIIP